MRWIAAFAFLVLGTGQLSAQSYPLGLETAPAASYGAIPEAYSPLLDRALPVSVDLSDQMPPPGKQSDQSCVGWASAYALKTFQENVERAWDSTLPDGEIDEGKVFSPAFVYNQINHGVDKGSNFGEAFQVLARQGAAPLSAMPYTGNPFAPVTTSARQAAAPFRIDSFRTVKFHDPNEVKAQLAAGLPVLIGMKVYANFESLPDGAVWNAAQGPFLGNHAMAVVGYDDQRQAFKVINSWGREWSSGGFGWIGYNLFDLVVNEAYVVIDLKGVDTPAPAPVTPADVWKPPVIAPQNSQLAVSAVCQQPGCQGNPNFSQLNYIDPYTGAVGLRLTGTVAIPPGVQGQARIVIPLSFQANGSGVASLAPAYALPSGQAAFGTPEYTLTGAGITTQWFAFVPYCALAVPKGVLCLPYGPGPGAGWIQTNLVATPILFIDNFGVAQGPPFNFFVRL